MNLLQIVRHHVFETLQIAKRDSSSIAAHISICHWVDRCDDALRGQYRDRMVLAEMLSVSIFRSVISGRSSAHARCYSNCAGSVILFSMLSAPWSGGHVRNGLHTIVVRIAGELGVKPSVIIPPGCPFQHTLTLTLVVVRWGLIPTTSGSCSCHEHTTNLATGVSRQPVLDCGTIFHPDCGSRDFSSILSDDLWKHTSLATEEPSDSFDL